MRQVTHILLAGIGLVIIIPFLLLISLWIFCKEGRPILFKQQRVGLKGQLFYLWKFRTMINSAEKKGLSITVQGDTRITKIGSILRKYKLDELPQLFNVLKGDMYLVGPRPEVQKYVDLYSSSQRQVLNLYPGITDPASLHYINEEEILSQHTDKEKAYIEIIMPRKIEMNLMYAKDAGIIRDFNIIVKTFCSIVSNKLFTK